MGIGRSRLTLATIKVFRWQISIHIAMNCVADKNLLIMQVLPKAM